MRRPARSARRLTPAERRAALEAFALAPLAAAAIRLLPTERAVLRFEARGRGGSSALSPGRVAAIADAVLSTIGARCLTKALVVHRMLTSRGFASRVVLGVARDAGRVAAHAWLEVEGQVLVGAGSCAYAPLWGHDSACVRSEGAR